MPLQKGQVVLLDGPGVRSSVSGQKGVLLERDAATGRYRVRLCAEPWKCAKVNRGAIHPVDIPQGESTGTESWSQLAVDSSFGEPPAKCDYSLGVHKKAQLHDLPAGLKDVKTDWPLSPVRRGKVLDDRPLPHIQQVKQADLYRTISRVIPHAPEDRHEDSELMDFTSVPGRKAPVQQGRQHKLLPHMDSRNLQAIVEEDLGAEINRKMEQTRYINSFVPQKEPSFEIDHLREKEMDDRLDNLYRRAEEVKRERARRMAAEKAEKEAREREEREMKFSRAPSERMPELITETELSSENGEESEEQRILREFQEYEAESPSHRVTHSGHGDPSAPAKDAFGLDAYLGEEGFEDNKGDGLDEATSAIIKKEDAWEEDFEADAADAAEPRALLSKDNSLEIGDQPGGYEPPAPPARDDSITMGELGDVPPPPSFAPGGSAQAFIPQPPAPVALSDSASGIDELD